MKERPLIFDAESVRAISRGEKTQTRRVMKLQPIHGDMPEIVKERYKGCVVAAWQGESEFDGFECHCLQGQPGDRLWVRETYAIGAWGPDHDPEPETRYRAHNDRLPSCAKRWRSPIHMPRRLSRLTLRIEDIRIETIQQIKFKDILREGVGYIDEQKMRASFTGAAYQREWLKSRWDGINTKRGFPFESNPWVWVIEFRVVKA